MAKSDTIRPLLALMPCPIMKPLRVVAESPLDIENDQGAMGVGLADMPDGSAILVLSMHAPDGETLIGRLDEDTFEKLGLLINSQVAELRALNGEAPPKPN